MGMAQKLVLATAGLCFLIVNSGCSSVKWRHVDMELERDGSDIRESGGQRVEGYTLSDGTYHEYNGRVYLIGADSLAFRNPGYAKGSNDFVVQAADTLRRDQRYALKDVVELRVVESSGGLVAMSVLVVLVGLVIALNAGGEPSSSGGSTYTGTSCPFLYSWDGDKYVFDAEPYGGATMSSLQRTDYSELEQLQAETGEYRLLVGNQVDETQHTDALHLLVADHPAGTRMVMDREGKAHCFGRLVGLNSARDEAGNDLSVWLRDMDHSGWNPDLASIAAQDSLTDTRNHITLDFPRPDGVDRAHLVANVGTGHWGSYMLRVMLSLRGNRVREFYDAVNANPVYQQQLAQWNDREDLFTLDVELQVGDHWEKRAEVHGGGPYISELRAIPLDLTGVEGETVRVRLHPPIGFWRFDSFHLGIDEVAAEVTPVAIATAKDAQGADLRTVLATEDAVYLSQPTNEDWAEATFAAPPAREGLERTVFAVTSGWYDVHLYADGPPDSLALQRLAFEPGYAVRRAMAEYADFSKSGILRYNRPELVTP